MDIQGVECICGVFVVNIFILWPKRENETDFSTLFDL